MENFIFWVVKLKRTPSKSSKCERVFFKNMSFKKFFNYWLVNVRNVSNGNFNVCVNIMNKSGSHFLNWGVDEYHTNWGKIHLQMRLQRANTFALLKISMPLRLVEMLTKNLSYLMIIMITMMKISSLLLSRNILALAILISMTVCTWLRI